MLTSVKPISKTNNTVIKAYPNPASQSVSIDMPVRGSDQLTIQVINYQGQVVQSSNLKVSGVEATIRLDVDELPAGNYIIKVDGNLHKAATKLIKVD